MNQHKYRARRSEVDGITFASRMEADRYVQLRALEKAGKITNLELQPKYELVVNGVRVGRYVGDFQFVENGETVTEDVKGVKTSVYQLKKRMVFAQYGIRIRETQP